MLVVAQQQLNVVVSTSYLDVALSVAVHGTRLSTFASLSSTTTKTQSNALLLVSELDWWPHLR